MAESAVTANLLLLVPSACDLVADDDEGVQRLEEQVRRLSAVLRAGNYGPFSFYKYLEEHGIDWRRSALIESIPEQGCCLCGRLIDRRRRLVEFDIDFAGSGRDPLKWGEVVEVGTWDERDLAGEWWKIERPSGTQPRPNDPITIGLTLLSDDDRSALGKN